LNNEPEDAIKSRP